MSIWTDIDEQVGILETGLSGFYRFSETGSNDRVDSYNGHILGAIGSPSTAFGVVGDGLSLDGIGQKLYHDKLSHGGSRTRYMGEKGDSFTISIWVKPADITKQLQFICGKYEDVAGDKNWALHLKNDSVLDQDPYFQFTMWENLTVSTECFVSTGGPENWGGKDYQIQNDQWYHLVAGYDRGNQEVYLYVNNATSGAPDSQNRNDPNGLGGKLVSPYNSCEVVYMEPVVAHKFSIGGEYSNPAGINYFEGTIDLFGCWHKILASGEIKSLWNEGNGLNLPLGSYIPANPKVGGFVKAIEYVDFYPTNEDGTNQVPSGRIDLGGYVSTRAYYVYPQQQYLGGSVSGKPTAISTRTSSIGGYFESKPYTQIDKIYVGGMVWAAPMETPEDDTVGAWAIGYSGIKHHPNLGGYVFGRPSNSDYAEARERTLVKAQSDNVSDQSLNIDSQIYFMAQGTKNINAQLINYNQYDSKFNAKLKVQKWKQLPTVIITGCTFDNGIASGLTNNVEPSGRTVTITASGTLGSYGESDSWAFATIDFGNPEFTSPIKHSISGFLTNPEWSASHTYSSSGIYTVVIRAVDSLGYAGSDSIQINLASGLTAGIEYPYISISGTPRVQEVPPTLDVVFTTAFSGVGATTATATNDIIWNFGNGEYSRTVNPTGSYVDPGVYTPIVTYKYTAPNGNTIKVSDTLKVGYNQ